MNVPKSILVVIGAIFASFTSLALTETVNGITWTYTVSNGQAEVGGGTSSSPAIPTSTSGAITIPSTLGGYPVTSIGAFSFYNCSALTRLVISDSVMSIGEGAFYDCSGLMCVTIPDSVTSIGNFAFAGCSELASLTMPENVASIGSNAFIGTPFYDNLPDGLIVFGRVLFAVKGACPSVVTIPDGVMRIACSAFSDCSVLSSVTMPDSVTSIGQRAFYNYRALTNVTIPNSVTSIEYSAFAGCSGLTNVTIPGSVTSIGPAAFSGCSGLTGIDVEKSNQNFMSKNGLLLSKDGTVLIQGVNGDVVIPNTVTSIVASAFYDYSALTSVSIPDSVISVESSAFSGCSGLRNICVPQAACSSGLYSIFPAAYQSITNVTISGDVTIIGYSVFSGCSRLRSVAIPDGVTSIGNRAFYRCSGLESIAIPDSVTQIGDEAFSNCTNMRSVTIGNGVLSIGERAFDNCKALTGVYISDVAAWCKISFSNIYASDNPLCYAHNLYVDGLLLKDLTLPASVKKIGDIAFYNCTNLLSVAIPNSVTNIGSSAFYGCSGLSSIAIPNSVTNIGSSAFYGCSGLTSIEMPDSVTSIGPSAFYGCSGLTSIEIPDSVTSIGWDAFRGCTGLENIAIPNSVTSIGRDAFGGCRKLRSVTIPQYVCTNQLSSILSSSYQNLTNVVVSDGVTCIGAKLFYDCYNLKSITIPSSVTRIGNNAFSGCDELTSVYIDDISALCQMQISVGGYPFANLYATNNLYVNGILQKNVTIPNSVTNIGEYAFYGCSGLTSVTIPGSVTRIGSSAFSGCSGLRSVTIPDSVTSIGSAAFRRCGGLTSVTISDRVTSIKNQTFEDCSDLTSIEIPASVTSIGYNAFKGCVALKSAMVPQCVCTNGLSTVFPSSYQILTHVVIADDVTSIGDGAFSGCTGLVSVLISDSVTSVGASAFAGCGELTSIALPDSVASIGEGAFSGCSGLEKITLPFVGSCRGNSGNDDALLGYIFGTSSYEGGTITKQYYSSSSYSTFYVPSALRRVIITDESSFGYGAFSYCNSLTNITFGSSVASIGSAAFRSCDGLTSVTIPSSVVNIGNEAFDGCTKLAEVHVDDVASWCEINFGNYYSNPLVYANKFYMNDRLVTNLEIPSSVTSVEAYAFCECSGLTSVTIRSSVTNIGSHAFAGCVGLTSATLPDSVVSIGDGAFNGCSGLESMLIGDSVMNIGASAFEGCSRLVCVTIPNSVRNIGAGAFSGCSGLSEISMPFVGSGRGNTGADALLGYIFGTSSYEGGTITKQYYSSSSYSTFYIPSTLRRVIITDESSFGYGAFSYCSGLTNITFGSSVTRIGAAAFRGCSSLTGMSIPKSVVSIGNQAFDGCSKLTNVHVDDVAAWCSIRFGNYYSNPLVYANKFYVDDVLVSELVIPDSVESIGDFAFCKCSGLLSVTIPGSVTHIGSYTFRNCTGLTQMNIPDSVKSIGGYAFYNCTKLKFVKLGNSITSIGEHAFENCSKLASVTIPDSVTSIGGSAFSGCSGLTSAIIGNGVTSIGSSVFYNCSSLTSVIFDGDAPSVGSSAFSGVATNCRVYVRRASSGWGVEILGTWQGVSIDYVQRNVTFDANGGDCAVASVSIVDGSEIGQLPTPTQWGYTFKGWWTSQDDGEKVTEETIIEEDQTLYARWERHSVAKPVTVPADGSVFYGDSCEVMITCATDGAVIYYSTNGVLPEIDEGHLYAAPFVIADTTVVKAVAVFEGVQSDCVTVAITKEVTTLNVVLDAPDSVAIASDSSVPWQPVVDDTAKVGGSSARSGAIGNRAETWLSATVEGAGAMTFWCKTSCEHDEDNMFTWDRLMIYTNDVEIAEWRMDGETDWTERTLSFEGGVNTVKWVYYKDRTGADGEDCAWVDAVTWTPSEAADPIPAVAVDADAATANAAVDGAGFVDAAVKVTIGGSATEYNAFKTWADGVKGVTGDALAGEAAVVANAHAAAAYLLGAERLFENEPTVEIGELAIVDGESAGTTAMTVAVTVKDGESAVAVDAAKVAAMFEATGDLGDWTGAAKLTPMVTNSGTDASGKMTFVVIPGDGTATKAFFRIRK